MTKEVKAQLEDYGILSCYLYTVKYNWGHYDCYSVDLEKIKYYDPKGFKENNLQLNETKNCDYDMSM